MAQKHQEFCVALPRTEVDELVSTGVLKTPLSELPATLDWTFKRRCQLENNPEFRHPATYVVLRRGNELFNYQRTKNGSEGRLYGQFSIGVGGHLDITDIMACPNPLEFKGQDLIKAAILRELQEEVGVDTLLPEDPEVIIIANSENDVNHHHFSITYIMDVSADFDIDPAILEDALYAPTPWRTIDEMRQSADDFEPWTRTLMDLIQYN